MVYLTEDDLILINSFIINKVYPDNIHDLARIESAVNQIKQSVFGKELYDGIFYKASVLTFLIAKGHGFVDGNKRTAIIACNLFLNDNGISIDQKYDLQLGKQILNLTTGLVSKEEFAVFLEKVSQ